jgi:hypothetical protein
MQEMHQNVIEDCARAIELDPGYVKAVIRRAQAYEATDKLEDALDGVSNSHVSVLARADALCFCFARPRLRVRGGSLVLVGAGRLIDQSHCTVRQTTSGSRSSSPRPHWPGKRSGRFRTKSSSSRSE